MKFRAQLNYEAQERLHRNMLPAMERMGKTAQLLLTPEQVMLVQLQDDGAEGCLVKMELPTAYIFDEATLTLQSNKSNSIAFQISVPLLAKIFAAAAALEADSIQMQLTQVAVKGDDGAALLDHEGRAVKQPILRFHCLGMTHSTTQELPIGKPYTASQIDDLLATLGMLHIMDFYVDLLPQVQKLEALLATLGRHAQHVKLLSTASGTLHAQVETDSVTQGLEMAPLDVFPPESAAAAPTGLAPTPDGRFLDALGLDGDAAPRVEVVTKVLTHALAAAAATQPHYLLLSCGHTGRPVLHLMCAYQLPDGQLDHKSALHIWMISRADDE